MKLEENVSLKEKNTFALDVSTSHFITVENHQDVVKIANSPSLKKLDHYILSEGSNTLLTQDIKGLVIHPEIKGIEVYKEDDDLVVLEVGAGENWHQFVSFVVERKWGGIENLALIPGAVGAAPVQNVAAYGQNTSDTLISLEAVELKTGNLRTFSKEDCQLGYRTSYFKQHPHTHCITRVRFQLHKSPELETSYYSIGRRYDSVQQELEEQFSPPFTIQDTYQAVINIRSRKLPDPRQVPNVGSFFINPVIKLSHYKHLQRKIPDLQAYPVENLSYRQIGDDEEQVKVPVGRLLDARGWSGRQVGNCKIYHRWASIITHNGHANGEEIHSFAKMIQEDLKQAYDITLDSEVTII